jgi:hypothetical protein
MEVKRLRPRTSFNGLFAEERRGLKLIPNGFGEKSVLKLMFDALICATRRRRACASLELGRAKSPPSERSSTGNTRPQSRRWVSNKSAPWLELFVETPGE